MTSKSRAPADGAEQGRQNHAPDDGAGGSHAPPCLVSRDDSAPASRLQTPTHASTSWSSRVRWKKKVRLAQNALVHAFGTNRFKRDFRSQETRQS